MLNENKYVVLKKELTILSNLVFGNSVNIW